MELNTRCLITGANSGIGKETAIQLAKKGFEIVIMCRNKEKAEAARAEISNVSKHNVGLIICDLAFQQSIQNAAKEFKAKYDKLDVLINNAGFIAASYGKTKDGFEQTFGVNHLGAFLLTNLLIDVLKSTENAKVITVSSEAHRYAVFDENNLQMEKGYGNMKAYCSSKLCNVMFARELAKRLKGTSVTSYSLHPGVVASNFATEMSGVLGVLFRMVSPFMISNKEGAETSVFLATNDEVRKLNGHYFKKKKSIKPIKNALNDEYCKRLWQISEKMTGLN
ncbi:SDR family oxidoreductase [Chondrinema litorale]|uniref:SDR family oxidoreductase n=1 Tax=Chondrinema litorale TaxID=2994555 RepID=UPI00254385FD|nr:SDR family oxidoreductase [Chondrinema litorale]UZR95757.1 SDR family oxidoreductase [Chondrinema litorale]